MAELAKPNELEDIIKLLTRYSFDLGGYAPMRLIDLWLQQYPPSWLRPAVIEALYQGRYKAVSVEQILMLWTRRGQPIHHFNHEFERIVGSRFPKQLKPTAAPATDILSNIQQHQEHYEAAVSSLVRELQQASMEFSTPESTTTPRGTGSSLPNPATLPRSTASQTKSSVASPRLPTLTPSSEHPALSPPIPCDRTDDSTQSEADPLTEPPSPSSREMERVSDLGSPDSTNAISAAVLEDLPANPSTSSPAIASDDSSPILAIPPVLMESSDSPTQGIAAALTSETELGNSPDFHRPDPIAQFVPMLKTSEVYTKLRAVVQDSVKLSEPSGRSASGDVKAGVAIEEVVYSDGGTD